MYHGACVYVCIYVSVPVFCVYYINTQRTYVRQKESAINEANSARV
jgi:hypothetical protein